MKILFFAHLRDATGCAEIERHFGAVDAAGLWDRLIAEFPALGKFRPGVRLARNGEYVDPGAHFSDADEVALIPPVSGG
ncbi:MAG: MoaD/ThiS family protein [Verrucomicrobia bacterium]|nr:MoaD/ThiS family protein [Verrucomicrobiota bacterium]